MNQIGVKVYYEIKTGNILLVTSECEGAVEETTKEQDMQLYEQLKNKNINEIDCIKLEYGVSETTFLNAKSYEVNLETKQLEVIYYTEEELEEIQNQNGDNQNLNERVSDISAYLNNSDKSTISSVEDTILEVETNKISEENGGM